MNKYLKNLNRIEFVVTMACTGKCKHCSQGEHKNNENIDKYLAADSLRKISEKYNIQSVMTFGGEPLLRAETVYEIHKTAKMLNIPERQLITNGFFSNDFIKIKSVALKLAECGVNEILLSVDAFHQETIPIKYVKAFAEEVKANGIALKLHPAWLLSPTADNIYNNKTRDILDCFSEFKVSEGNIIFPAGNAVKYLGEYFDLNKKYDNPYQEDPTDIYAICFSANGDVLKDNIYKNDIIHILNNYKP